LGVVFTLLSVKVGVVMMPKKLDEEVAFSHLATLDIKLTKLSPEKV
jgi:S-adenosylhomocysteine hydrolase